MHVGANIGYAIAPLEALFYLLGLELAGGDAASIHFTYKNFIRGRPNTLPEGFGQLLEFDPADESPSNLDRLSQYVRLHRIEFVLFFDIPPVHPLFRRLRQAGARTILAYWGAPMASIPPAWKFWLKRLHLTLSDSKLDGLIFESRAMADLAVQGRGIPQHMLDVVPLGVDTSLFQPGPSDYVYEQFNFPRDRRVIVYAGHMEPRKGVHSLVHAAVELLHRRGRRDVCFLLCGNKGEESREYEQIYAGLGLDPFIRFGGYRQDFARILPGCFCGVIPSTGWDSFPRTPLEMGACGLPVIASRLQGLPEAVLDGETGLLYEPGNVTQLADAIASLLDQPQRAAEYGRKGRLRCEGDLHISTQRRRLLEVVRKRLLH